MGYVGTGITDPRACMFFPRKILLNHAYAAQDCVVSGTLVVGSSQPNELGDCAGPSRL